MIIQFVSSVLTQWKRVYYDNLFPVSDFADKIKLIIVFLLVCIVNC